jgi:hypothetical protein
MKAVLLGMAALLAGVLALEWQGWAPDAGLPAPPPARAPAAGADAAAAADVDPFALEPPPKEEYASVVERPLFLPERRPPPDEPEEETVAEEEPLTELDGVDLTAVVITPALVSAWVRGGGDNEVKRLRLGDDFLGWTVKTIEPARLVLERQGETDELPLRDYANAPPPIPPTRLPPSGRAGGERPDRPAAGRRRPAAEPAGAADEPENVRRSGRAPVRQSQQRAGNRQPARQPPSRAPARRRDATP